MIEISHITKVYDRHVALDDVSLTINDNEVVSIIGHAGSGKSTLLQCIAGLESPDSGTITMDGKGIGIVFQEKNLFPHLTVLQNMTLAPIRILGMSREEAEEMAMARLVEVGLGERPDAYPDDLSMGQRQRVAIARCQMLNPRLILMDEPTSSLDPVSASEVIEVIKKMKRENVTVIIVTHVMSLAEETSDRIVFMDKGKVCETGSPDQIIYKPQQKATKDFMDYTMSLVYEIASSRYDHPELNARMEFFCTRYRLGQKAIHSVQLVVEELLHLLPLDEGLRLVLSKSGDDAHINICITMKNSDKTYIMTEEVRDDISFAIISGLTDSLEENVNAKGEKQICAAVRIDGLG